MKILSKIFKYLSDGNIVLTVLVTVISNYVYELINSLVNNIILPIVDREKYNTKEHYNNLNDYVVDFNGIRLKTGAFLRSLIKFVLIMIIIFVFVSLVVH